MQAQFNIFSEFKCPHPDGTFSHVDCHKFWHCTNGVAIEKECPANLIFEEHSGRENKGACVWPEESTRAECFAYDISAAVNVK